MIENSPNFENVFLRNVVETFHARSKAIKYRTQELKLVKDTEELEERLNIDVKTSATPPFQIRLSLWGDYSAYFRTCQKSNAGWQHMIEINGYLVNCNPCEIERRFENSFLVHTLSEALFLWPELSQC